MKMMLKDVPWTKVWLREAARQAERDAVEAFAEDGEHGFLGMAYAPGKRCFRFSLEVPDDWEQKRDLYRHVGQDIRQLFGVPPLALIVVAECWKWDTSKPEGKKEREEVLLIEVEHAGLRGFAVTYPIQLALNAEGELVRRLDRSRCERFQQKFSHRSLLGREVLGPVTKASPERVSVARKGKGRAKPAKDGLMCIRR